jgi:chitodextrinase
MQTTAIARPKNITVTSHEIQLDGSQSTSADGKPLTYLWTIPPSSPSAAILHGTTATPTAQFTQGDARYTFQLTVTDSTGNSSTDFAVVDYYSN